MHNAYIICFSLDMHKIGLERHSRNDYILGE